MSFFEIIQIITAAIGSFGFGVLFNIRGKKLLAITLGGGIGWIVFLLLIRLGLGEAACYFIVATLISVYAEIMARLLKAPTTVFITPSLIPFIPGSSLYYTLAYAFDGNSQFFFQKAMKTVELAAALAIGVIAATVAARLLMKIWQIVRRTSCHKENKGE